MKRLALLFTVGGIILAGVFGYVAMSGEITGKTFAYDAHANPGAQPSRRGAFVSVSHDISPTEFRHANNFLWAVSGISIVVAGLGIYFFRGIDDYE
jgi:hypothetical protein